MISAMWGFRVRDKEECVGGRERWMPCLEVPVSLFNSGYRLLRVSLLLKHLKRRYKCEDPREDSTDPKHGPEGSVASTKMGRGTLPSSSGSTKPLGVVCE